MRRMGSVLIYRKVSSRSCSLEKSVRSWLDVLSGGDSAYLSLSNSMNVRSSL